MKTYLLLLFIALGFVKGSIAETLECNEITSLPAVINQSGKYCLFKSFDYQKDGIPAISIDTRSANLSRLGPKRIILDFNGHQIKRAQNHFGTLAGIKVQGPSPVIIRNGSINDLNSAIEFTSDTNGHVLEDFTIFNNPNRISLNIESSNTKIDRCNFVYSSILVRNQARDVVIQNSQFFRIHRSITATNAQGVLVQKNKFYGPSYFVALSDQSISQQVIRYRDNYTVGMSSPYEGGLNIGENF